jgi:hypothetical protein
MHALKPNAQTFIEKKMRVDNRIISASTIVLLLLYRTRLLHTIWFRYLYIELLFSPYNNDDNISPLRLSVHKYTESWHFERFDYYHNRLNTNLDIAENYTVIRYWSTCCLLRFIMCRQNAIAHQHLFHIRGTWPKTKLLRSTAHYKIRSVQ